MSKSRKADVAYGQSSNQTEMAGLLDHQYELDFTFPDQASQDATFHSVAPSGGETVAPPVASDGTNDVEVVIPPEKGVRTGKTERQWGHQMSVQPDVDIGENISFAISCVLFIGIIAAVIILAFTLNPEM